MSNDKKGYAKLLEYWTPPESAGDPVGCIATSYTFKSEFFEEECLGRFICMESDPNEEDNPEYLLELEEKLNSLNCKIALVDQHHCVGPRSLRWDLLSVRTDQGIMHAKVTLLYWTNLIRIIIASANLTENGYRSNREVFGVIDFTPDKCQYSKCAIETVEFIRKVLNLTTMRDKKLESVKRGQDFLDIVVSTITKWSKTGEERNSKIEVSTIFSGLDYSPVIKVLQEKWTDSTPPYDAYIISPFFDTSTDHYKPAKALWDILRQRGKATITYNVIVEDINEEKKLLIRAPQVLKTEKLPRESAEVIFEKINIDDESRILHMKSIWLENDNRFAYMVGSSNFTTNGLGIGGRSNIEANLVYYSRSDSKTYNIFAKSYPDTEEIDENMGLKFENPLNDEDDAGDTDVILPKAFDTATYMLDETNKPIIKLVFNGIPPKGWKIRNTLNEEIILTEAEWQKQGKKEEQRVSWDLKMPPAELRVYWDSCENYALWPVNISNANVLPQLDELKDLPLETLIEIISSAKPYYKIIKDHWRKKKKEKSVIIENDPLKRVDTSSFLLQRTRKFSWALIGMCKRLEKPYATVEALQWWLNGPVGVQALKDAIYRDRKSDQEGAFLLCELALALSRISPVKKDDYISEYLITKNIQQKIVEIADCIKTINVTDKKMKDYISVALKEALK